MVNPRYTIPYAVREVFRIAAKQMSFDEMKEFQLKYKDMVEGYHDSDLVIYSTIALDKYQPFQEWLPWLIENKDKVVPALISKMLSQDIFAEKIYILIQEQTNPDILLKGRDTFLGTKTFEHLKQLGGGQPAHAIVNAELWLASNEAAELVANSDNVHDSHAAHDTLCTVNGMLGIDNEYIDCN